jgi:signal transduction histidine kinase
MRLSYKQKLFLYFFVIFTIFTAGIIGLEWTREKKIKTNALEDKIDAYAEIIRSGLSLAKPQNLHFFLDSIVSFFPPDIRLTIINRQGTVLYDNTIDELSELDNHAGRPEVKKAFESGKGTSTRISTSNNQKYLYYAKRDNDYCIRIASPYNIQLMQFLKPDNVFFYYLITLFLVIAFLINVVTIKFGKSIKKLRNFAMTSGTDELDFTPMNFPDDELGEIGVKITEHYTQLTNSRRKITLEREKLLQHVHSSGEGLCFFSAAGEVEFYNGLFIQYLNMIVDGTNSDPRVIFTNASFDELNKYLLSNSGRHKFVELKIKKQGKTFSVWVNIFDDNGFEIILNDVTQQEKTRLLKQEMTSNIAHELRTPVTSIRGYLETLLYMPLPEDKKQYFITQAYNQTIVLSELIQDMSLITRMEEAPHSFQLEWVNISRLLDRLKNDLALSLQEKSIRMEWNVPDRLAVKGNKNLLYSVFRNLTDNVIRYAGKDVLIRIKMYNEDKNFYYFSYADTGVGISNEKHLNRLFERFYRINEGRTRDTGGTGLGLSIVKNAISFHKGTIVVKNRTGGGLEFLFKIQKNG